MAIYTNEGKRTFTIFKDKKIVNFKPTTSIELTDEEAKAIIGFKDIKKIQLIVEEVKETEEVKKDKKNKKKEIEEAEEVKDGTDNQ